MRNPLLKKANGFDNPTGKGKTHYTGFYPEAVGGGWNPQKDNNNLRGEISEQLGGYAPGTRGAEKTQKYIDGLYRGTQEPPTEPEGKKPQTGKWLNASKTATGEMSSEECTPENYPIHFAIANAVGGTVEPFDVYQGPYIDTNNQGYRLFISEQGGTAVVVRDRLGDPSAIAESNAFDSDDEAGAVEAALSLLPEKPKKTPKPKKWNDKATDRLMKDIFSPKKEKKIRKTPEFSEADKIQLHGLGVKGSLKAAWDKALRIGILKFESNRYAFTKNAGEGVCAALKNTVVQVNGVLNRRHVPKSASAHEVAVRVIAQRLNEESISLDKMGSLAKRAANATHVLYDAGPSGYTVRVMKGNNTIDEYNGGNSPYESTGGVDRTDSDSIKYDRLLEFAETTAKEMAEQYGVPENMVDHDEDLLAEEREEAWGLNEDDEKFISDLGPVQDEVDPEHGTSLSDALAEHDRLERAPSKFDAKFLKDLRIKSSAKPKCPHCGSTKYVLTPTDFETAKCEDCGKNWEHGIVPGINDPNTKAASRYYPHDPRIPFSDDAKALEGVELHPETLPPSDPEAKKRVEQKRKGKEAFFSPEDAEKFRKENEGSNVLLNEDAKQEDASPEDSKWEPVFDKEAAANFDTHWNENCPLPERERCDTDDADTCCGCGFAYNDKKEWVGVPCQCKECHPPLMGTDHPHAKFIQDKFEHVSSQKTASVYKVQQMAPPEWNGDKGWFIVGLPQEGVDGKTSPNSYIIPGLNHSLRTPEGLTQGIYEQLYDEFQTNDNLKAGDIFDTPVGQFICQGVDVIPHDEKAKAALQAVNDQYKCANCGCDQGDHRVSYDGEFTDYMECQNHPTECKEFKNKGKMAAIVPPAAPPPAFVEQAPASATHPAMEFPLRVQVPKTQGEVRPALKPQPLETLPLSGTVKPALTDKLPEGKTHMYLDTDKGYKEI